MAKITTVVQKEDLIQSPLNDANKVKASDINKIVQTINVNDDLLSEKTEKGGYTGTTQDLKDELNTAVFTGAKTYQTDAELLAVSPIPADGTPAKVANDPTSSKNGNYSVVNGAWVQDSSIIDNITVSEDIKTDADKLLFSDRSKQVIPESAEVASLGYKFIRSDFDFTSIPSGYDNATWEIKDYFDLGGATSSIPLKSKISFNGGKFDNATLIGNNTEVSAKLYPIFGSNVVLNGTWIAKKVYPEWFGVVGDGVVDDTDAFEKCVNFCADNDLTLGGGAYLKIRLVNAVTLLNSIKIDAKFTILLNEVSTFQVDVPILATTDITSIVTEAYPSGGIEVSKISVSDTTGFEINSVCKIYSTDAYVVKAGALKSEMAKVIGLGSGVIYVDRVLSDTYSSSPKVQLLSDKKVSIKGIKLTYDGNYLNGGATAVRGALSVFNAVNPTIDVEAFNHITTGVDMSSCWLPDIKCVANNLSNDNSLGHVGYGVRLDGGCRGGSVYVLADNTRHAFTTGLFVESTEITKRGIVRETVVSGTSRNSASALFDTHEAVDIVFSDCHAFRNKTDEFKASSDSAAAFQNRGLNTTFVNCTINDSHKGIVHSELEMDYGEKNRTVVNNLFATKSGEPVSGARLPNKVGSSNVEIFYKNAYFYNYFPTEGTDGSQNQTEIPIRFEDSTIEVDENITTNLELSSSTHYFEFARVDFIGFHRIDVNEDNNVKFLKVKIILRGDTFDGIWLSNNSNITVDGMYFDCFNYAYGAQIRPNGVGSCIINLGSFSVNNRDSNDDNAVIGDGTATFTINDLNLNPFTAKKSDVSTTFTTSDGKTITVTDGIITVSV